MYTLERDLDGLVFFFLPLSFRLYIYAWMGNLIGAWVLVLTVSGLSCQLYILDVCVAGG